MNTLSCLRIRWGAVLTLLFLCSCSEREGLAPVVELNWRAANQHETKHTVAQGETLYAIAFRYDQDYRQLALNNHLTKPYTLRVGQVIYLRSVESVTLNKPIQRLPSPPPKVRAWRPLKRTMSNVSVPLVKGWLWPIQGRVLTAYAPEQGKKGINIAGRKGELIHASSGGIVAYSGNGLVGYGNLIIIKHDHQYLTAYGNNSRNLVREGQSIKAGQAIAEIGVVDRQYWGLHFEIRKAGKPVNPLNYLQNG